MSWKDSKAGRLGRGLGTLFHQRETVPSQGTTLNHTALCLIILVALTSVLSLSYDDQQTLMQRIYSKCSAYIQRGMAKVLMVDEQEWWGEVEIFQNVEMQKQFAWGTSLVILDYPHTHTHTATGPVWKSATLSILIVLACTSTHLPPTPLTLTWVDAILFPILSRQPAFLIWPPLFVHQISPLAHFDQMRPSRLWLQLKFLQELHPPLRIRENSR